MNTIIKPLPGTGAPRFKALKYVDVLRRKLEASYQAHKPPAHKPNPHKPKA